MVWNRSDPKNDDEQYTTRRQVLGGAAASVTGLASLGWWPGGLLDGLVTAGDAAINVAGLYTRLSLGGDVARVFDTDQDGSRDLRVESANGAILITSSGTATEDYAASLVNLNSERLTLGDLTRGFQYEYKGGSSDTSAVPDEVWILLQTNGGRRAVLRTEVDNSASGWESRDVAAEITGTFPTDGSNQPWKEFSPDGRSLSTLTSGSLVDAVGADARVQAVGVGRGTPTTGASTIETYYRNLTVAGDAYDLPAQTGRGGGRGGGGGGRGP